MILLTGGIAYGYHAYNEAKKTFNTTFQAGQTNKLRNVDSVIKEGKPFSILLMGTDTGALGRNDVGRTDTMIVATINPKKETAYLTSIPRDTRVQVKGDTQPTKRSTQPTQLVVLLAPFLPLKNYWIFRSTSTRSLTWAA
ncbi:LCP family glycopolymer transferase [Secundilactobacillus silagei]|uniref:LCP family glycopolymer transferase n=1 Tax=Secundilactobacillus silagei TaxID=1293415 RepID=UPI000A682F1B